MLGCAGEGGGAGVLLPRGPADDDWRAAAEQQEHRQRAGGRCAGCGWQLWSTSCLLAVVVYFPFYLFTKVGQTNIWGYVLGRLARSAILLGREERLQFVLGWRLGSSCAGREPGSQAGRRSAALGPGAFKQQPWLPRSFCGLYLLTLLPFKTAVQVRGMCCRPQRRVLALKAQVLQLQTPTGAPSGSPTAACCPRCRPQGRVWPSGGGCSRHHQGQLVHQLVWAGRRR